MFYLLTSTIDRIVRPMRTINGWIVRYVPGMKRIPELTPQFRYALMTFFFLLFIFFAALVDSWLNSRLPRDPIEWLFFLLFPFALPVIVYWIVVFARMKDVSKYPEIDRIWGTALRLMGQHEIAVSETPLFVVLGAGPKPDIEAIVQSGGIQPSVSVVEQDADIAVVASTQSIYLFLPGCSAISGVGRVRPDSSAASNNQENPENPVPASAAAGGTMKSLGGGPPGGRTEPQNATINLGADKPATPIASDTLQGGFPSAPNKPQAGGISQPATDGGTILLPKDGPFGMSARQETSIPNLSTEETSKRARKLQHVCNLVRKERGAFCPMNGILSVMEIDKVEKATGPLLEAAQSDYRVLRDEMQVRCVNHVLISGMEKDTGFLEFIKRIDASLVSENRFGAGCDNVWAVPTSERLSAVGAHAVGAVEDWVYMLFSQENALSHLYNSRLFMLLCRSRGEFSGNLQKILAGGFGFDFSAAPEFTDSQFLFGGCYLAATGDRPEKQAFVKGVFKKINEREGTLDWAEEAIDRDASFRIFGNLFALVGMLSVVAIIVILLIHFKVFDSLQAWKDNAG